MKKNCNTCGHWVSPVDIQLLNRYSKIHGQCMKALMAEPAALLLDEPMIVMDGSYYMAVLFTLPDHSCKAWKMVEVSTLSDVMTLGSEVKD